MSEKAINEAFVRQTASMSGMNVGLMWDRLKNEFLLEYDRLARQGLSTVEISARMEDFLEGLSEKPLTRAARTTAAVAYNQGRSAAMLIAVEKARATHAIVSEILDEITCLVCKARDGMLLEIGTDEYYENMPPADCEGGDMCRGFGIAVARG
jgi:hypothetical protein